MVEHTDSYYDLLRYFRSITSGSDYKKNHMSILEERAYISRAKAGDTNAWLELVKANAGLFIRCIGKSERISLDIQVSLSESIGYVLGRAYERFMSSFDVNKNCRFSTYIINEKYISQDIRLALGKNRAGGITSAPRGSCSFFQLPFEGSMGQLSESEYEQLDFAAYSLIAERQKQLPRPADFASLNLDKLALSKLVEELDERSRHVILGVYFESKNYEKLSHELNVSGESVRVIHNKAIKKLRFKVMKDISLEKRLG